MPPQDPPTEEGPSQARRTYPVWPCCLNNPSWLTFPSVRVHPGRHPGRRGWYPPRDRLPGGTSALPALPCPARFLLLVLLLPLLLLYELYEP